jgi:hypothetical protein
MPDENPTRGTDPALDNRDWGELERSVLYLLTDPQHQPTVWSIPDIGREMAYFDPDALVEPLWRAGLVHRLGKDLVFARPAAFHFVSLVGHVA